ncbi:dynein axonemal assembly factor 9 isoform X1 [Petromyzon marinus]|uniref:dynein axonemal assembly factor 9 isoform X1 n=1 Tax=Petromyzon marinus TaxID=7757 RepID=UPI003F716CA9
MSLQTSAVRRSAKGDAAARSTTCSRLRQVQRILLGGSDSKPDALLCILGIDSRYNEGCSELANYLLFGFYAQDHSELDRKSFPEEVLDDVIILVKPESVHLYCNPVNYPHLVPYVARWRNLQIHCMTAMEYEDEEAGEEFKITSFVNMVQDCKTVGVPYSAQGHPQKFDMFVMEKWPMIQAFALEGLGGGGFFTMKHELVDLSEDLWEVYSRLDPVSLESLITEELVLFEWQWKTFFSNFDIESPASILDLSEAQVGEPFRSYFNHGMLSSHIPSKTSSSSRRQPLVLFGIRTGRQGMEEEDNNFSFPSESHLLRNTGPAASHARHMIIQCSNPKGPLSCARTYFFGSSHTPYMDNNNEQQMDPVLRVLSGVYASGVEAVLAGIVHYTETGDAFTTKATVEQLFFSCLDKYDLSKYKSTLRSALSFTIQPVNLQGRVCSMDEDACRFHVKTASLLVYDIPDLEEGRFSILGSVAFSESFLDSRVPVQAADGSLSVDGKCAILTANIPRYTSWLVEEAGVILSEKAQEIIKGDGCGLLGKRIAGPDLAYIHCSSPFSNPEEGKLTLLSSGILFVHRKYGSVILPMSHMTAIKFYDGDSCSVVAMVVIEYKRSLLPFLPFHLSGSTFSLAFGLMPKSTAYKTFYREVLSSWRNRAEEFGVALKMISQQELSEHAQLYTALETKRASTCVDSVGTGRPSIYTSLPHFEKFLKHFEVSSVLMDPILSSHFKLLINPSENENQANEDLRGKMVITIITGLPGSHRERLCATLVNLSKEHDRWAVLHNATESGAELNAEALQRYLSGVLQSHLYRSPRHALITRKKLRILMLTPGFADVVDVVQAIRTHPDPTVGSHFVIGAITACVNPLAACMEHSLTFPKLLEQCAQGWASNVVLTGPNHEKQHPRVKQLKELIRLVNPSAALIQAENGNVSRNEDIEMILSENSFNDAAMVRARHLLTPGWASGMFSSGAACPAMQQISVRFNRPLEKPLFIGQCKALKGMLSSSPFCGNIYSIQGRLKFSDSPKVVEVSHVTLANNSLTLTATREGPVPRPPPAPRGSGGLVGGDGQSADGTGMHPEGRYHLVFTGCGLREECLKDWLRRSAKQITKNKTIKTKESLTQKELMSIHATRHLDPLPPGYFYNGMQFINFFGEKSNQHPLMETFIDEHLERLNAEINKYNAQLQRVAHHDLFEA